MPGLSRRALFGLGVTEVRRRFEPVPADAPLATPAFPSAEDTAARWGEQASWSPRWEPVVERAPALAVPAAGERVHVHRAGDLATVVAGERFDVVVAPFGMQTSPAGLTALRRAFELARPGGRVVLTLWTAGPVLRLLRRAAELDPMPRGWAAPAAWGRHERIRQDLERHSGEATFHDEALELAFASPEAALDELVGAVPALGAAVARRGETAREAFRAELAAALDGGQLSVPYVAVVATAGG